MTPTEWGSKFTATGLVVTVAIGYNNRSALRNPKGGSPLLPSSPRNPHLPSSGFCLRALPAPSPLPPPSLPLVLSIKIVYKSK